MKLQEAKKEYLKVAEHIITKEFTQLKKDLREYVGPYGLTTKEHCHTVGRTLYVNNFNIRKDFASDLLGNPIDYSVKQYIKVLNDKINKIIVKVKGEILEEGLNLKMEGTIKTTEGVWNIKTIRAEGEVQRLHTRFLIKKLKK